MQLLNIVFLFLLFLHYVYQIDWMTVKLQQYVTQIILISFIVLVLWDTWLGWEHYIRPCYLNRAIFVWPWQMVAVSVCYLFYQPMEEKIKTWPLCFDNFPPKKNLIWKKHCLIGQSCCSMMSKRSIGWFLESSGAWSFFTRVRLTNQKPHAFVSFR